MEVIEILVLVLIAGILLSRSLVKASRWKRTGGMVLSSEIRPAPGSHEAWVPLVTFRYRLDGRDYTVTTDAMHRGSTGSTSSFNPWSIPRSRESALAVISSFRPGAECTIYYDATDPTMAVLSAVTKPAAPARIALIAGVIVILIAGLTMFLFASKNM